MSIDYDRFYDDYYGLFYDGYWGPGDVFFYTDALGHPYHRDDAHHFRHDAGDGFHAIHGHHAGPTERGAERPH